MSFTFFFFREVQTLRPDIMTCPEIQFALQVYSAINSNNYIKFFKLIRKATYLNACILHRYFPQVRSKALMILMRALSSSSRPVPVRYIFTYLYVSYYLSMLFLVTFFILLQLIQAVSLCQWVSWVDWKW